MSKPPQAVHPHFGPRPQTVPSQGSVLQAHEQHLHGATSPPPGGMGIFQQDHIDARASLEASPTPPPARSRPLPIPPNQLGGTARGLSLGMSCVLVGARLVCAGLGLMSALGTLSFGVGGLATAQWGLSLSPGVLAAAGLHAAVIAGALVGLMIAVRGGLHSLQVLVGALNDRLEGFGTDEALQRHLGRMQFGVRAIPALSPESLSSVVPSLHVASWTLASAALGVLNPMLGYTWAQLGLALGAQAVLPLGTRPPARKASVPAAPPEDAQGDAPSAADSSIFEQPAQAKAPARELFATV